MVGSDQVRWVPTGLFPFEAEAANLFFQLVSSRYERASVIVTSNKPFGRWGEVFGDVLWVDGKRRSLEPMRRGTSWLEAAQAAAGEFHGPVTRRRLTQQRRRPLPRRAGAAQRATP